MIRKPSPIHSFFKGFKVFTAIMGSVFSAALILGGLATGNVLLIGLGIFVYWLGHSILNSIDEEEKREHYERTDD